jgi:hypothetical protein
VKNFPKLADTVPLETGTDPDSRKQPPAKGVICK